MFYYKIKPDRSFALLSVGARRKNLMFLEPVEKHHFSGEYQPLVCMYVLDVGFSYLLSAVYYFERTDQFL